MQTDARDTETSGRRKVEHVREASETRSPGGGRLFSGARM